MRRVFVVEPSPVEYLDGLRPFGEIYVLFDGERPPLFSDEYVDALHARLRAHKFNPRRDYVGVAGKQVPLFILAAELGSMYVSFTALLFSASERRYVSFVCGASTVYEEEEEEEEEEDVNYEA